jgi:hypothetical protein
LELVGLKPLKIKYMTGALLTALGVLIVFSIFVVLFISSGEWTAKKYPESRFAKWWRRNVIDVDPRDFN